MTKSLKLSIVIPFYNTPTDLFEACLKSIAEQKCDFDYEIIAIDDGSKDAKPYQKLCQKYGADYHHKANGGVSTSRNYGIEQAGGEFILFIDADDYIDDDYLERTMAIIDKNHSDILICGHTVEENGKQTPWNPSPLKQGTRDDIIKDLILKNHYYTCAGGIFRARLAKATKFHTDIAMGEDTLFVFEVCKNAKVSVDTPSIYHYIKNNASATKASASLETARKQFADNTKLYTFITPEYPKLADAINTALTSKAYDALSLYADDKKTTKDGYIALCKEFAETTTYSSKYVDDTDYGRVKKQGMKLLAKHNYSGSFRLNRLKNLAKNLRKRI